MILFFFAAGLLGRCSSPHQPSGERIDLQELMSGDTASALLRPSRGTVFLFTRISSFNCPPCLDSYQELAASLVDLRSRNRLSRNVLIVAAADSATGESDRFMLDGLIKSRGWNFPHVFVPGKVFEKYRIEKTSELLAEKDGAIESAETFPLESDRLKEIIERLNDER